jgi:hypothetical protein
MDEDVIMFFSANDGHFFLSGIRGMPHVSDGYLPLFDAGFSSGFSS